MRPAKRAHQFRRTTQSENVRMNGEGREDDAKAEEETPHGARQAVEHEGERSGQSFSKRAWVAWEPGVKAHSIVSPSVTNCTAICAVRAIIRSGRANKPKASRSCKTGLVAACRP